MMLIHYLVLTTCFIGLVTWVMIFAINVRNLPPDSDEGGPGPDSSLPIVDLPPGSSLSDWLTDRLPETSPQPAARS